MEKGTIPKQQAGSSFDVRETIMATTDAEAGQYYAASRERLLNVNSWGDLAGEAPDTFILTDALGKPVARMAAEGDLIKIHLPGPRTAIGDGADWVRIEKIEEQATQKDRLTALTVRPTQHPELAGDAVVHFYSDSSTNTFIIHLHGKEVTASIHGRNEQVNSHTDWLDLIRNLVVALPAKAGFSNPHWQMLAKGLIGK